MATFVDMHAWPALRTQLECCAWQVRVAKEELDAVSDLRYSWKKLCKCASEASDHLAFSRLAPCIAAAAEEARTHSSAQGLLADDKATLRRRRASGKSW